MGTNGNQDHHAAAEPADVQHVPALRTVQRRACGVGRPAEFHTWELPTSGTARRRLAESGRTLALVWGVQAERRPAMNGIRYGIRPQPGPDGEPQPVTLRLDGQAKRQWVSFFDEHAEETAALSGELAAVWAKLEAYAARLALLVHLVRLVDGDSTAGPECIDADSVAAGVKLARWFGHEARRLYSQLSETEEDTARRQLAELIGRLGGRPVPGQSPWLGRLAGCARSAAWGSSVPVAGRVFLALPPPIVEHGREGP